MKYLLIPIILLPAIVFAQPAPDFSVTDSDGIPHTLYSDYLNQEKTVLVQIFFTTCPPCRSIASSMEIFYQQWGAGEGDVEFIEMSNKSFDDNVRVNNYKAEFGITFPSVGAEGGSLESIVPYTDGTYGPFFGTPTFIVIAPDGEVQYDVDGPDLWEALDDALHATGALKPGEDNDTTSTPDPEPVIMEGAVKTIYAPGTGIGNAIVTVTDDSGNIIAADTTLDDGSYTFELDSAVVADNDLFVEVHKYVNPTNGVTASDLVVIQKHLLGIGPLPETADLFASDANLNQSISAADLLFIKRLLLGYENEFADGETWEFFHADLNLGPAGSQPPVLNRSPVSFQMMVEGEISTDFKGIKRADVNHSATPGM